MAKFDGKKIIFGFFLIGLAIFIAICGWYIFVVKPELAAREARKKTAASKHIKTLSLDEKSQSKNIKTLTLPENKDAIPENKEAVPENTEVPAAVVNSPEPVNPPEPVASASEPTAAIAETPDAPLPSPDYSSYSEEERNRREGLLWNDKKTGQFVATLGAVQGLTPGARLQVYDGDKLLGDVEVDSTEDVVAYVHPLGNFLLGAKQYFRVIKP
jgi:hypothetical protein